jgi:hypothetical protein
MKHEARVSIHEFVSEALSFERTFADFNNMQSWTHYTSKPWFLLKSARKNITSSRRSSKIRKLNVFMKFYNRAGRRAYA